MKFFQFYYYTYLFRFDPSNTWFRHSIKILLATLLATIVAFFHLQLLDIWFILTTFLIMLMANVSLPLKTRIKMLIQQWFIALVCVMLMLLLAKWWWIKTLTFLVIVFFSTLLIAYKPNKTPLAMIAIIFALLAMVKATDLSTLPTIVVYFIYVLAICLLVTFFIWPERLAKQIENNTQTGIILLGRYLCYVIGDAALGNQIQRERSLLQQSMLNSEKILADLIRSYHASEQTTQLSAVSSNFKQLCYAAIALESSIQNLASRAYLRGPMRELQSYMLVYKQFFLHAPANRESLFIQLAREQKNLEQAITVQQALIFRTTPHIYLDFSHWNQVAFYFAHLNQLIERLFFGVSDED